MAEGVIQQSDISVEDVYGLLTASNKKYQDQVVSSTEDIKKQSTALKELLETTELLTQKGLDKLMIARQKMGALQEKRQSQDKKVLATRREAIAIDKKLIKEKVKLQEARKKETQQVRRVIKLQQSEKNSIEALRAKLALVTHGWTKLTEAETKNTKRGKRLTASKLKLTNQLKALERATGDNRREVGNYSLATKNLGNSLRTVTRLAGQFGLALGGAQIIRGTIGLLTEFDEKLADIIKTTGLSKQGAQELSQALLKIDTRTSITNLQELASSAGRLGITGKANILAFAESADKVFVALGDDLSGSAEEIATNLGKISSLFGLEGEFGIGEGIEKTGSSLNELSANSKASAGAILDFTQRMGGLASILELSDVQALGALFDETGQSVEVASSTLNKLLPSLSKDYKRFAGIAGLLPEEFKKIAEDSPIEALKLVATGAKSSEKGLFALTDIIESFGVKSARATGIVGVLTDNVERLGELQDISTEAMEKNTSIADENATKQDTLSANYEKLKNSLVAYILGSTGATEASKTLTDGLKFIRFHLGTIIFWLGKAIKAYVAYQVATSTVVKGMIAFGKELIANNLNLKKTVKGLNESADATDSAGKSMDSGAKSAKALGGALKSIGFALAITAVLELASAFFDLATGVDEVERQVIRLATAEKNANENLSNLTVKAKKYYDEQMRLLDRDIRKRIANGEDEKELAKERLEGEERIAKEGLKIITDTEKIKRDALAKTLEIEDVLAKAKAHRDKTSENTQEQKDRVAVVDEFLKGLKLSTVFSEGFDVAQGRLAARTSRLTKEVVGLSGAQKEYNDLIEESTTQQEEFKASFVKTEEAEERISLLRQIEDERIKQIEDEEVRQIVKAKSDARRATEDMQLTNAFESEKADLRKAITDSLEQDLTAIEKKWMEKREKERLAELKKEAKMVKAWVDEIEDSIGRDLDKELVSEDFLRTEEFTKAEKEKRLELLKTEKTAEEIEEEMTKFLIKALEERIALRAELLDGASEAELEKLKDVETEKLDLEIELAELRRKKLEESAEGYTAFLKDQFEKGLDMAIENSKERQKLLDKEISKQQEVVDSLRKGANDGNAIASESLALEESRLEDRERARRREAQEEETLEQVKMLWNSINSFLDQGDPFPEAVAKGTAGTFGVKAIADGIGGLVKSFFTGTKGRLKDEDNPMKQGRDGHLIWADGDEGILTGKKMDSMENAGLHTTDQITQSALLGAQLKGGQMPMVVKQSGAVGYDLSGLQRSVDGLRKDMASRPTQTFSPWMIDGFMAGLRVHEKENGIENIYNKPFDS